MTALTPMDVVAGPMLKLGWVCSCLGMARAVVVVPHCGLNQGSVVHPRPLLCAAVCGWVCLCLCIDKK